MKWTEKQQEAIDKRNCSLVVSAAAGSGKTAVLVERLTQIILDEENKTPADKLVVVTFTNDAAAEIKKRLKNAINQKASEQPDNQWLKEQQILLHKAKISTIHTFCYSIIRDNIDDEKITSSFNILDTTEAELLRNEALDKVLNDWHENHITEMSTVMEYLCYTDDSSIENIIKELDDFLSSVTFRDVWLEKARDNFSVPYFESVYYKKNIKRLLNKAHDIAEIINTAKENSYGLFSDEPDVVQKIIIDDENVLKNIESYIQGNLSYLSISFQRFTSKKKNCIDPDEKDKIKNLRDNYKSQLTSLANEAESFIENSEFEYKITATVFEYIEKIYTEFKKEEFSLKQERNSLSFADAEEMVIDILCEHDKQGRIYPKEELSKISSQYDMIMIDEFQDSNNKQDIIFKLLSKNNAITNNENGGIISYGGNVFIVGDTKQSIYSFRQANPENFTNILETSSFSSANCDDKIQKLYLNTNFRSSNGVIDFVNSFFCDHMSEDCGEVVYSENEMLNYGAVTFDNAERLNVSTKTKFLVINENVDKEENAEEQIVAEKINDMLENKAIVIDKDGSARACRPSDFCIIVRKNSIVSGFSKELKKYGISVDGEKEEGYLQSEEIAVLINMLRLINNPSLDLACTSVLMSPMFMFSSDDMLEIKNASINSEDKRSRNIMGTLRIIKDSDVVSQQVKIKTIDFIEKFDKLRKFAVYSNLTTLVQQIYEQTGYASVVGYNEDGKKKTSNLRLMFHYTSEYTKRSGLSASLSGFLMYIDKMNKNNANFNQASSEKSDAVQIKTCHGSKGLEYPFVFVVGTHSKFSNNDSMKNTAFLPDGSVSFKLYDRENYMSFVPTEFKRIIEEKSLKQTSEEMRLLYVAFTRARQQLFVTYDSRKIAKSVKSKINADVNIFGTQKASVYVNSMAEWLYMYLCNYCNFDELSGDISTKFFDVEYTDSPVVTEAPETIVNTDDEYENISDKTYKTEINDFMRSVNFKYGSDLYDVEARKTVSDIIKEHKEHDEKQKNDIVTDVQEFRQRSKKWKRPEFMIEKGKLKGNEKGTAVHQFFQYLDFDKALKDIEAEKKRLLDDGYMNSVYIDAVPDEYVKNFLSSHLGQMVCNAAKQKIYREKQILIKMSDIYKAVPLKILEKYKDADTMLKGVIDLYFFNENNDLILVDYKTDKLDTEADFISRYSQQLNIYAAALKCIENREVKKMYLYSFNLKKEIEVPVTD